MSLQSSKAGWDDASEGISVENRIDEAGVALDAAEAKTEVVQESSIDPENEITGLKLFLIHTAICLCTLLVGLDFSIIATAVPMITSDFNSIEDVTWYASRCATQPLAGKIYTLFSRKLTYLIYVGIFEIGSLVCALAPNSGALIVGRAISGIGASGLLGGGLVILTTIIPLHKRAIWQGTWSCVFSISTIVGPLIGGALTEHVTWRWCFYLNLPIGGAAAIFFFVFFNVKKTALEQAPLVPKLKSLDSFGTVLFAGFMIMLLLALQWAGAQYPWDSVTTIGLFVGAGVSACLFVPWQLYLGDHALIPPKLFITRNAGLICLGAFFVNGPFQTVVYWLPVWFQGVLRVSPVQSSVRYLPTVISDVLAAFISAGIVMKTGWWNPFLVFGTITMAVGGGLLTTLYPGVSSGCWIGYQILVGIGYALVTNMAHLGMQASLPQSLVPIGATSVLTVISASCAIFLAVSEAIFEDCLQANLPTASLEDLRAQLATTTGVTNIRSQLSSAELSAFSKSVTQVWYLPAAAPVLAFILVCLCSWISLKKDDGRQRMAKNDEPVKGLEVGINA